MNFSKLAIVRENKDLSQRKMAKILGVSKSTYARWETMEKIIPLEHLNNYCNYFNITMDYILNINETNMYFENSYNRKLNKKIIGNNIKMLRRKYKLTQKDLADYLNTSQSTISAYESGKTLILTVFIFQLAIKFNLSIDNFCNREVQKNILRFNFFIL